MTPQLADLKGPLPSGTTVLEASAGTGKTYTIAGLVARFVAERGVRIDQLLVVTFGRAATSELRSRVRERLVQVRDGLLTGGSSDPVVEVLSQGDVALHVQRLSQALAAFDSATVATTHEFCHQVLRSLGVLADHEPQTVLVESLRDLVSEVADDLYLRFSALAKPPFNRKTAQALARTAVEDPTALLLPTDADPDSEADLRVRFCTKVREEVERRKRSLRILGFDDLLGRVAACLQDDQACQRLRDRYRVVLVDEFQDTDPVQWDVLQRAFHGSTDLVVIGDPKQAIYAFRGADVRAYLAAAEEAEQVQTLGTNFRSDPLVLDGLERLFRGAALGHPRIAVSQVEPGYPDAALLPLDEQPVRLRVLTADGLPTVSNGRINTPAATTAVAQDVADQVVQMLEVEQPRFTPRGAVENRALSAGDVAVLVRNGKQAAAIRTALLARGVPVVLTGTESVFLSDAALDWSVLLEALEQPHRSGRVRRFALTAFVQATPAELDDAYSDALAQRLRGWADVLADRGVAGLFAALSSDIGLVARLLGQPDGERVLTDLRHVAETLHRQGVQAELGLAGLVSWLHQRRDEAGADASAERSRRLDTDRSAVQVMTVWVSKGLEFPVVLVPFGWHDSGGFSDRNPRGHDGDRRTLFVGGSSDPGHKAACAAEDVDSAGEDLRLLYVAMTRAISRLVLWWAPTWNSHKSPLDRLLLGSPVSELPLKVKYGAGPDCHDQLRDLCTGPVSFSLIGTPSTLVVTTPTVPTSSLHSADFTRALDGDWRRTSYTGLLRGVEHTVGSEPPEPVKDDEPEVLLAAAGGGVVSPWHTLPGGAGFGTLVHRVLERADLAGDWQAVVDEELARGAWDLDRDQLVAALGAAVATPVVGGRSLLAVPQADQLRELDFEMPLAGGDQAGATVRLSELAALLQRLPEGDPVRAYASVLTGPLGYQVLRGYLGGSIDVVLRVDGRFYVADHKTNRLAPREVELTSWHYRKEALDAAMLEAGYPLQALLYTVALHRYLRWRLPGYDPAVHLGGVRYLFLRGMVGGDEGVWSWEPPAWLVEQTSDLLAGSLS